MASGLVKMPLHASQFSADGFRVPASKYCSQSLPAGDLMPSGHSTTTLSSDAVHRGHGAMRAPHSSTSSSSSSRAFYNSYYPPPPQHKPLNAPSDNLHQIALPPSPPVFDRPAGCSLRMSEEFPLSSAPADGFSGFSEMSRSLTDFGANPLHAQSIPSRSIHHHDSYENGDDRLCSQIDGLNISATSSSPTVLSIMTEYSLKQRQSQSRGNGSGSVFSALSSSNSSRQTSPNATQRMSSMAASSSSDASSSMFLRHNNVRATACVPEAVQEEVFEFEMEETDDMRPASSSNSSSSSTHGGGAPTSSSLAALNNQWRGVM